MATENEVVAIGNTGTDTDALITMIGQLREIGSKKRKIILNTAKIELSSVSVNTEEMTRETITEPIASLRLHEPVLPFCILF